MNNKKRFPIEWKVTWIENGCMNERRFESVSRLRSETLRINRRGGKNIQVQVTKRSLQ